jgi:hypothetical protein
VWVHFVLFTFASHWIFVVVVDAGRGGRFRNIDTAFLSFNLRNHGGALLLFFFKKESVEKHKSNLCFFFLNFSQSFVRSGSLSTFNILRRPA